MGVKERKEALLKQLTDYPPVLNYEQVQEILNISRNKLDDLIKRGVIKSFPVDPDSQRKTHRVTKIDLVDYMTNQK